MATLDEIKRLDPVAQRQALESMSTDELQALQSGKSEPKPQNVDLELLNSLPTDQLLKLQSASPEARQEILTLGREKTFGENLLSGVKAVTDFLDKFGGAPLRAGIQETIPSRPRIEAERPPELPRSRFLATDLTRPPDFGGGSLARGVRAFGEQFGEDPALAPTGKDIAKRLDFSTEPAFSLPLIGGVSPAGAAGLGIEIIADPLNLIPVTAIVKGAAKGVGLAGKLALKGSANAVAAVTPGAVKQAARGAKVSLDALFKPSVADDFAELAKIAEANGVTVKLLPESVEFGPASLISRSSRVQREGIQGEALLKEFQESLGQVRGALDNKLQAISKSPVLDRVNAGQHLRDSYDRAVEKMFSGFEQSYSKIAENFPDLVISPKALDKLDGKLDEILSFGERRSLTGVTNLQRSQGKELVNAVTAIRAGGGSFEGLLGNLRDIGDAAFSSKNQLVINPPDVGKLRGLYRDVSDALIDTVRLDVPNGAKVADKLIEANKVMTEFFGEKSVIAKILGNKEIGTEKVFDALIKNGDTRKIEAIKSILSKEDFDVLKGSFVESIIKREADGFFSFRNLSNSLRAKRLTAEAILDPSELKEIADIVRLGDRFGLAVMSTSGTGASNILRDIMTSVKQSITNEAFIEGLKKRARAAPKQSLIEPTRGFSLPRQTRLDFGIRAAKLQAGQQRNEEGN